MNKITIQLLKKIIYSLFYLMSLIACAGCAGLPSPIIVKAPDLSKLGHKPSLYIIVDRNKRLPQEFTAVFKQLSQEALPDFLLFVSEVNTNDQEIAQSDWIMTVRTTRIIPSYSFKPFQNNALNGVNDCLLDSAFAIGLLFIPCIVVGDTDFLEANIRDAHSNTLKTYNEEESEGGFTLLPPLTYLTGLDEKARWQKMIHNLYGKISADQVFRNPAKPY
ncbi:MAG TPA: hypothetical protein VIJ25_11540 [Methylococcales bacterium]